MTIALLDINDSLRPRGGWLQLAKLNSVTVDVLRITGIAEQMRNAVRVQCLHEYLAA